MGSLLNIIVSSRVKVYCLTPLFQRINYPVNFAVEFVPMISSESKLSTFRHASLPYTAIRIIWQLGHCPRPRLPFTACERGALWSGEGKCFK